MQYSPKLKKAMQEIKDILDRNDIAGIVVLHEPGYGEFFTKLNPSYSCVKVNGDDVRIVAKLQDFGGDKKAWEKKVSDTSNMFHNLTSMTANILLPVMDVSDVLDKQIGAIHEGGSGFSSNITQNN